MALSSEDINLGSLPYENLFNILINLPFNDIINYCLVNLNAAAICNDNSFWKQKAFYDFGISSRDFDRYDKTSLDAKSRYIQLNFSNKPNDNLSANLKRAAINNNATAINFFIGQGTDKKSAFKGVGITGNLTLFKDLIRVYPSMKYVYQTLYSAIKNEHMTLIKYIMENYYIQPTYKLYNATMYKNRSIEIVDYIFKNKEIESETSLDLAAKANNIDIINYLLLNKIQDQENLLESYLSIIIGAAEGNHIDLIIQYIKFVNPNSNCVKAAANGGNLSIIEYFLSNYRSLNTIRIQNEILISGAAGGHLNIIQYAIKNGANELNKALNSAAVNNHLDTVKYLVDLGANDFTDALGSVISRKNSDIKMVEFLVKNRTIYRLSFSNLILISSKKIKIIDYLIDKNLVNSNILLIKIIHDSTVDIDEKLKLIKFLIFKSIGGKSVSDISSEMTDNLNLFLQDAIIKCELAIVEYLLSTGLITTVNRILPVGTRIKLGITQHITQCFAVKKYFTYLSKHPNVKILDYEKFADKIKFGDIIEFKNFKPQIQTKEETMSRYLVPLQMALSTDKEENKYITLLRYNKNTNEIYPVGF